MVTGDMEQAIRERYRLYVEKIKKEKIKDKDQQRLLHDKMIKDCLISLAKVFDRTYKTLLPEEILKEMFGE